MSKSSQSPSRPTRLMPPSSQSTTPSWSVFGLKLPQLTDYSVRIPPGGKTGALVETVITWRTDSRKQPFSTMAVDTDQIAAAVKATEKMLNLVAADDSRF